jgi:heptosyltransferase-2
MPDAGNLLLVRLFAIGDVVMATSAVRLAREALPDMRVSFLVGRWSAPVLERNADIDELIVVEDEDFFKRRWTGLVRIARDLRKRRFDVTVSFHGRRVLNLFLSLATRSRFYCLSYEGEKVRAHGHVVIDIGRHKVALQAQLVSLAAGGYLRGRIPAPSVTLGSHELARGRELLAASLGHSAKPVNVALCPGGGKNPGSFEPVKRWGTARYAALVRLLQNQLGAGVILVGSPDEAPLLEAISARSGRMPACVSGLDLRGAASVLAASSLVIGNDSGLLHVASAAGKPTLTIFGPTSPSHTSPFSPLSRIAYKKVSCSPCDITKRDHANPVTCSTMHCMKSIEPEEILAQIRKLMDDAGIVEDRARA